MTHLNFARVAYSPDLSFQRHTMRRARNMFDHFFNTKAGFWTCQCPPRGATDGIQFYVWPTEVVILIHTKHTGCSLAAAGPGLPARIAESGLGIMIVTVLSSLYRNHAVRLHWRHSLKTFEHLTPEFLRILSRKSGSCQRQWCLVCQCRFRLSSAVLIAGAVMSRLYLFLRIWTSDPCGPLALTGLRPLLTWTHKI